MSQYLSLGKFMQEQQLELLELSRNKVCGLMQDIYVDGKWALKCANAADRQIIRLCGMVML